jgi:cell division protein FtsA
MKNNVKYIVAIDLGTTKVVSIAGEKIENNRYKILAYSEAKSYGIINGQIKNIDSVTKVVIPTLEKIKAAIHIDVKSVYIGIAGRDIACSKDNLEKIRDNHDTEISKEEIEDLKSNVYNSNKNANNNSNNEIIDIIPQTYSVDELNDLVSPIGYMGKKLTGYFYVITGDKSTTIHVDVCMKELNLYMPKLILEPIASAKTILNEDEKEVGVVMIDIGGGTTDLVIYKEKIMRHVAVIAVGGNFITEDIKRICDISFDQAENAKIQCGLLELNSQDALEIPGINGRAPRYIYMSAISQIISYCLQEIIDNVMNEIKKAECENLCKAGIVITGGVSRMRGIEEFIRKQTNMEVKIGVPDHIVNDSADEIFQPKYSTAVGLIICGFEHAESSPPAILKRLKNTEKSGTKNQGESVIKDTEEPGSGLLELITTWLINVWDIFIKYMNPQQDEKND